MSREDDFDDIMDSDEMETGTDETEPSQDLDSVDESEGEETEILLAPPEETESVVEKMPAPVSRRPAKKKKKAVAKPKPKAKKKAAKPARKPAAKKVAKKKTTAKKKTRPAAKKKKAAKSRRKR